jgi:hypothetical protein
MFNEVPLIKVRRLKIKVTKGYQFSKSDNVFKEYIEELSEAKDIEYGKL